MSPWRPLPGDRGPEPEPVGGVLDKVLRGMGAPEASGVHQVFDRWAEVVGEGMAARTRPASIDGGVLVIATDEPAMATHIRFLETELVAKLADLIGPGRVRSVEVRVEGKRRRPGSRPS
jgi:predicted nucleic acid-binding Zn ribbon protein